MVTFVMIPAGVLLYRDDTGKTVAEKLAQRARIFAGRPMLGMFVVMFVIINLAYFAYGTRLRHHQVDEDRDVGRVPLALSGSQSL